MDIPKCEGVVLKYGNIRDVPWDWICDRKWCKSAFRRWREMWRRCNNSNHPRYNNYKDCKIDERYRYFSEYLSDIMKLENFDKFCDNPSEWHIDKDIKDPTNRHYTFENLSIIYYKDNTIERNNRCGHPTSSFEARQKISNARKKPIKGVNIKDGSIIFFDSAKDAEEKGGFNHKGISSCIHGRRPSYKGYKWELIEEVQDE